jgi:hypothetical protein
MQPPPPRVKIIALEHDERGRELLVIDPKTKRPIPSDKPTEVAMDDYWARRLIDRSVEVYQKPAARRTRKKE